MTAARLQSQYVIICGLTIVQGGHLMSIKNWNADRHWLSPGEMPLHQQVRVILATQIATGKLKIGDRLPNEGSLSNALGISRSTLRHALAEFEREGLIERTPRRGTYLRRLPPPRTTELPRRRIDRFDLMRSVAEGRLVRRGYEVPPAPVSRELAIPPGDSILYFLRVQTKFNCRAAIKRYIKSETIPSSKPRQPMAPNFMGDFSHGWVESLPAEPRFAGLLHVEIDVPLLSVWWVECVAGSPSICSHLIFGGNDVAFSFTG
jgi:DNA-binding transcriptional regulator YhcF (GntR family)